MSHKTEVENHGPQKWIAVCETCRWRSEEWLNHEFQAEDDGKLHEVEMRQGAAWVKKRDVPLAQAVREMRRLADRETCPEKEREEYLRLADEMENFVKVRSKVKPVTEIDGQDALFDA